jgi:hypothetical protein
LRLSGSINNVFNRKDAKARRKFINKLNLRNSLRPCVLAVQSIMFLTAKTPRHEENL